MPKKLKEPMIKNVSALIARTQFRQILERVSRNQERFLVTKKGEARAVILGIEDFMRSVLGTPEALSNLQEQAKRSGASKLSLEDIEQEIQAVRRSKLAREGKKAIVGYFDPSVSRQLREIALAEGKTLQGILREALNDFFAKRGKSTIA